MGVSLEKVSYRGLKKISLDITDNSVVACMGDDSKKILRNFWGFWINLVVGLFYLTIMKLIIIL